MGAATALLLAEQGSSTVVHYNRDHEGAACVQRQIEERGGTAITIQADLRHRSGAQLLAQQVMDRFGQVDVLINNAGSMIGRQLLTEINEEFWREVIDTNTNSVLWMTQRSRQI